MSSLSFDWQDRAGGRTIAGELMMASVGVAFFIVLATASPSPAPSPSAKAPLTAPGLPFQDPQTVDEFMKGLESDTTGYYFLALAGAHPRKAETFLRAARKQAPSRQQWAGMVTLLFKTEDGEAKRLPPAARTAVYQHALAYLQEWYDLTASALEIAPADKQLAETSVSLKGDLAVAALEAGQLDVARKHATEALAANTDVKNWNYGNIVHEMNEVLGRAALRAGNRDSVGKFWARDDPKHPQWSAMAKEHAALLAKWKDEIRAGKIPTDGNWR